jgi:NAD(P)-dependent dehydrogenase (short-subunit alcohol dehydrogenase family)
MNEGAYAIVGAGPGNGAAIGAEFAAAGYRVALCARDKKRLKEMAEKIRGASTYAYDVKDTAAAPEVFARIRQEMGPVNVLIYNAGAGAFANIDDATLEDFQSAWEVNCRGLFLAVKEALPDMRATGKGSIVIIGATASIKGGANFAPFASAKAGQRGLAQSLARYLGSAEQILAERVAGKIGVITRRATKVVAGTTMPRSATPWVPDFTTTQVGPGFAGGLLCQAPREGGNHSRRRLSRIPPRKTAVAPAETCSALPLSRRNPCQLRDTRWSHQSAADETADAG